nr:MAG TPA: hypothetical protein [Bacteriophage sp.]
MRKRGEIMLIVALQDDVDNLYAIWNTVTDRFLGVNLDRDFAMDAIIQYKHCSIAEANSRLDNPQPFSDIAKAICNSNIKSALNVLRTRCHKSARDSFDKGNYGILHIVTADELK